MTQPVAVDGEDERCPLCPAAGPPTFASVRNDKPSNATYSEAPPSGQDAAQGAVDDIANLVWIACSRCETWYHSCCLLLASDKIRETIPQSVRQEVETNHTDEAPFFDWTVWINRWYCLTCLEKSRDPSIPGRLHHPLVATTKPNFPPRQNKRKSTSARRSPSAASTAGPSTSSDKRPKLEDGTPNAEGSSSRPKRAAALNRPDYHAMHHHISTPTGKWLDLIANPEKYNTTIVDADFPRLPGKMVARAWIEGYTEGAGPSTPPGSTFYGSGRQPIIVRPEDGGFEAMGGKLPGKDFTVQDVAKFVGPDRAVDVIDVATQSSSQWSLKQWADYVRTGVDPTGNSSKVYNIISLEITGTELAKKVRAPQLVREIDWVDNFWNFPGGKGNVVDEKKQVVEGTGEPAGETAATDTKPNGHGTGMTQDGKAKGKAPSSWPKVQLYCLMGMKGSWTDWHVDFAASSVYYTIHSGSKVFYFIRPTEQNLKAYNEWSGSYEMQQNTWLGDMCDEVKRVVLVQGDTMIIPAGYIHAVYTPINAIVFGGNFVHSYDIPTQLRLRQIEIDTKVPQRFRFPFFDRLCWYVADKYCSDLRQSRAFRPRNSTTLAPPHPVVLDGLVHLAQFLITQTDILENPDEDDKKKTFVNGKIPQEVVKDPSGLARELLWRAKRELGLDDIHRIANGMSVDPVVSGGQAKLEHGANGRKSRKMPVVIAKSRTTSFSPVPWQQSDLPVDVTTNQIEAQRPSDSRHALDQPEPATQVVIVRKQNRHRLVEEDGVTILEKQEVIFTETKTTWSAGRLETIKSEPVAVSQSS